MLVGMNLRGMMLGEHELLAEAGSGGFSTVWKARHAGTGELRAIKLPRVEKLLEHLRREASLAAHVRDPQVVPVLEAHLDAEVPHLVLPWIEGETLELPTWVPFPSEIVGQLETVLDLARVVGRLHAAGVVHGDLKPGNVIKDREGRVQVLDLGLARVQLATKLERSLEESLVSVDGKSIAGTLDFMAPELVDGRGPSAASDVYGLGVLLHHLLTGRPPAFGVSPDSLNEYLPPGTAELLRSMLHHDPAQRVAIGRVVAGLERLVRAERRCLARKNGHARRLVSLTRRKTLARGLRALGLGLVVLGSLGLASWAIVPMKMPLVAIPALALGVFAAILPLLLAMTTINAWILRIPEKTYKHRKGHRLWTFMMQ